MGYKLDPETGKWTHVDNGNNSKSNSKSNNSNNNTSSGNKTPTNSASETKAITDSLGSNSNSKETSDVDGNGTAIGNTRIKKYGKGLVTGIGKAFEGLYYFSSVKHTINGSGFVTEFSVKAKYSEIGAKSTKSKSRGSKNNSSSKKSSSTNSSRKSSSNSSGSNTKYKYVLDPETGKYKKVKA